MFRGRKFKYLHRENLWESSDEEEKGDKGRRDEEVDDHPSNIAMIEVSSSSELNLPENVSMETMSSSVEEIPPPHPSSQESTGATTTTSQPRALVVPSKLPYQPRTLSEDSRRYSILPAFPTSFYESRPILLLANVPNDKLNDEQLARRRPGAYPEAYKLNPDTHDIPSYFRIYYQAFMGDLIFQLNIGEAIIDYNLYRMMECFRLVADDYIQRHKYKNDAFELTEQQMKYALEFYLQIDVDLFYMKTCSYRNAQPRIQNEGVFCKDEPVVLYGLSPCNNCPLCVPPYDIARRQQPTIRFGPSQKYRFVNGYQTILNCPADCHTRNVIYVMSCPCGEYEYIGETSQRVGDRLWYHRQHYNRIIHEFLIGERNVALNRTGEKDRETLVKDRMLLYRHAARCPWTMQIFLNFNPVYGPFVPMRINDAERDNRRFILPLSLVLLDSVNPTSIGSKDRRLIPGTTETRADELVRSCMRHIPPVPPGYTFSVRQRTEQFQYFKNKIDTKTKQHEHADLFNVALIAVLPTDASEPLRRFIEALFITHTEAKLNTSGQILRDRGNEDEVNDGNVIDRWSIEARTEDRGEWCRNLVR